MPSRVAAVALSTHPIPSLGVTAIALVLAVGAGLSPGRVLLVGLAIALNQASIGLSNDWLDATRDRAVGRADKPVASGAAPLPAVRALAIGTGVAALLLPLALGVPAALAQAVFLLSGWAYNLGLKSTVASALPYVVGFAALPSFVTLAGGHPSIAAWWATTAAAALGLAAHLANVLPDLRDDAATGVRGLPHRLGRRLTGVLVAAALVAASVAIAIGAPTPWTVGGLAVATVLAAGIAVLVVRGAADRLLFPLLIVLALGDVVLLATSGQRLAG